MDEKNKCDTECEGCECDGSVLSKEEVEKIVDEVLKENAYNQHVQQVRPRLNKQDGSKLGRNDKCPCGSNRKYKKCCLSN